VYGFALRPPRNVLHESIQMFAFMDDPNGLVKAKFGLDPNTQPFLLTESDPVPKLFLDILQMQSGKSKAEVEEDLLAVLKSRKASYFNGGDRMLDLQLLLKPSHLSYRERMALHVRLTETRIMDKALEHLLNN